MVDIEPARPEDAEEIDAVLRAAFADEDEAELTAVLREDGDCRVGCSTVARDEEVVGFAGIVDVELVGDPAIELAVLAPVAVRPDRQGEGIGSSVVREGMRACVRTGCDAVVTEGDPDYYGRFGFEEASAYGLESDLDPPTWAFQVWPCRPGALDGVSGVVRHPAPFHAL